MGPYSRLRCTGCQAAEGMGGFGCAVRTAVRAIAYRQIPLTLPHGEGRCAANSPLVSPRSDEIWAADCQTTLLRSPAVRLCPNLARALAGLFALRLAKPIPIHSPNSPPRRAAERHLRSRNGPRGHSPALQRVRSRHDCPRSTRAFSRKYVKGAEGGGKHSFRWGARICD